MWFQPHIKVAHFKKHAVFDEKIEGLSFFYGTKASKDETKVMFYSEELKQTIWIKI